MKRKLLERITRHLAPPSRLAALLLAICGATNAWAVTKPLAVWNGDFPTTGNSSTRGDFTLSLNGNTSDGSAITILGSSASPAPSGGVTVMHTTGSSVMALTAVAGISNVTPGSKLQSLITFRTSNNDNQTGIGIAGSTNSGNLTQDGYLTGLWNGSIANKSTNGGQYSTMLQYPTDKGLHYFAGWYVSSDGTSSYTDKTKSYQWSGLKSTTTYTYHGVSIGGLYNATTAQLEDAKVSYVAVFNSTSVTEADVLAWSPTAMTSASSPETGTTLYATDNTTLATQGINLPVGGYITISGDVTVAALFAQGASEICFADANSSLTISGPLYVAGDNTLKITPATLTTSGTTTLITASVFPSESNISVTAPTETGYTYSSAVSDTAVTLTRTPKVAFSYTGTNGATPSGWFSSWSYNSLSANLRPGPTSSLPKVYEIADGEHPGSGLTKTDSFSLSVYADVSQMASDGTTRAVMASYGSGSIGNKFFVMYREGSNVKLGNWSSGAFTGGWAASVPVAAGYHLYTATFDFSTGTIALYRDDGTGTGCASSGTPASSFSLPDSECGLQIGNIWTGVPSSGNFAKGIGMALAQVFGYDSALTASEVAMLSTSYPATDGLSAPSTIDNRLTDSSTYGSAIKLYSVNTTDGFTIPEGNYLGISQGTMTIPSGHLVKAPMLKTLNTNQSGNSITVSIAGELDVTGATTSHDVWSNSSQNKGILLGHWAGSGTYNITGSLIARDSYMEVAYTASSQTINVNGGTMAVKGYWANKANTVTINLTNGGVIEVKDVLTVGKAPTQNFRYGTFKLATATDADRTIAYPINFTGTSDAPTTLDPYGHTLTVGDGKMTGTGYVTVSDSSGNNGTVKFVGNSSFGGRIILTDANSARIDISDFTGTVECRGTAAATLAKLNDFAGTVYFTSTVDASAIDLSGATVNVAAGCTYTAIAGKEGTMVLGDGVTAKLMVTTEVSNYEGHVPSVSGSGTLEYWLSDGEQTQLTGEDHLNGNNLLPYYYVWTPSETASENTISANAAARWKVGSLPTANKNVAFKISADTTVLVDATVTYGEVQVYGTGILTIQSADGSSIMTVAGKLQTTSTTAVQINDGIEFGANAGLEVVSTLFEYMSAINCGTEETPYSIPSITGGGFAYVAENKYLSVGEAALGTFYVLGNATVSDSAVLGLLDVKATGSLTLDSANVSVSGTATIGGTVNVDATSTFIPTAVSGTGRVVFTGCQPTGTAWATGSETTGWRGTMYVSGLTTTNAKLTPGDWGNEYSRLVFTNVRGYLADSAGNCLNNLYPELVLDNGSGTVGFTSDNGWGSGYTYIRKISGDGTLDNGNATTAQPYYFRDASEFTGSIKATKSGRKFIFSASATSTSEGAGVIYIAADGFVKIGDGNSWTAGTGGIKILGKVQLLGAGTTMYSPVTVSGNAAKITLADSALVINNTLTLSDGYALTIDTGDIELDTTPVTLISGLTNTEAPDVSGITVAGCTVSVGGSSGAYTIQATLDSGVWASNSGDWTEASFNGTEQTTDNSAVMFRASAAEAVTVTLDGTRAPSTVTFNGGSATTYTLKGGTFSPSGTVTIESGEVVIDSEVTSGVAFSVAAGAKLTLSNATGVTVSGSGELCIAEGGTVTLAAIGAIDGIASLSGSGSLVLPSAAVPDSSLQTLLKNSSWSGTVAFSNLAGDTTTQQWRMYNYGNSGSKIQFTNCIISYPINDNDDEYSGKLVLVGDDALKFTVDNGYSNNRNILGELTGSGTLTSTGNNTQLYMFLSSPDFDGNISTTGKRILFASKLSDGTATYANDTGAWVGTVRIASGASASIGAGANWVAFDGFGIYGTLIVKGANSYLDYNNSGTKGIILNNGATIRFDSLSTLKFGNSTLRTPTLEASSTVNIAFGEGVTPEAGTKLISWGGAPEGSFVADGYALVKKADGLYVSGEVDNGTAVVADTDGVVTLPNSVTAVSMTVTGSAATIKTSETLSSGNVTIYATDANGAKLNTEITSAFKFTDNNGVWTIALDETKVRVEPTAATTSAPTFTIATKEGLWYAVEESTSPNSGFVVNASTATRATSASTTLPAATAPTTVKYYKIAVGASRAALLAQ